MEYYTDGIRSMYFAVVERACKDYVELYNTILIYNRKGINPIQKVKKLNKLRKWFLSNEFSKFMPNTSGEYILRELERQTKGD